MTEERRWVVDTSPYTHLCRAGHGELIAWLAPGGSIDVPLQVNMEIENGRDKYPDIPAVSQVSWAKVITLNDEEIWTQLQIKARMGGTDDEHLGECEVLAAAHHRKLVAILDEREAVEQADRLDITTHDTLWLVVEAYKKLFDRNRAVASGVVDDLLKTGMFLPFRNGASLLTWAYEEGLLPLRWSPTCLSPLDPDFGQARTPCNA